MPMPVQALVATRSDPAPPEVPMGAQFTPQQQELKELVSRNREVFSVVLVCTTVIEHDFIMEPFKKV